MFNLMLAADSTSFDWLTLVGLLGGLVAFLIGLAQYRTTQQWKRAEFIADEMKAFFDDPQVRMAMTLLDYNAIRLDTNGRFAYGRPADDDRQPRPDGVCMFSDSDIISSLRDHTTFSDGEESFSDKQTICRFAFDAWLTGLERFDHFVETGLVGYAELKPYLFYWVAVMSDPATQWKDAEFYRAVRGFVRAYGYSGVKRLCAGLGRPLPDAG